MSTAPTNKHDHEETSMSADLPAPPVPPDCDLRDMDGFMLNSERLLSSELWALSDGTSFKAAVALWCRAWKQVPAASLPDNESILAAFAGVSLAMLRKHRSIIMRGFYKCSDGRLYHKTLAEDAIRSLAAKHRRKAANEAEAERLRLYRERKKHDPANEKRTGERTPYDTGTSGVRQDRTGTGTGTGTGQGQDISLSKSARDEHDIGASPTEPTPPAADADRWGYIRTEAWAKSLVAAGCKIGNGSWPAWKSLCDRWPVARVIEIAVTVPATERFSGQVEEALRSAGTASTATILARKTRTLDLSA